MIIVQKIYSLDKDAFLRCGIDTALYLCLLRNSIPLFKDIFTSIQQDSPFFQLLLQTTPNPTYFSLSSDNEIQQNLNAFYSALQDGKNRGDSHCIQNALRSLLVFRSSNIICYTAVFSILRLSYIFHPTDTLNDILTDYCFQYVRMVSFVNTPFKNVSKKDCIHFITESVCSDGGDPVVVTLQCSNKWQGICSTLYHTGRNRKRV